MDTRFYCSHRWPTCWTYYRITLDSEVSYHSYQNHQRKSIVWNLWCMKYHSPLGDLLSELLKKKLLSLEICIENKNFDVLLSLFIFLQFWLQSSLIFFLTRTLCTCRCTCTAICRLLFFNIEKLQAISSLEFEFAIKDEFNSKFELERYNCPWEK